MGLATSRNCWAVPDSSPSIASCRAVDNDIRWKLIQVTAAVVTRAEVKIELFFLALALNEWMVYKPTFGCSLGG